MCPNILVVYGRVEEGKKKKKTKETVEFQDGLFTLDGGPLNHYIICYK